MQKNPIRRCGSSAPAVKRLRLYPLAFLSPGMAATLAIILLPILYTVSLSFMNYIVWKPNEGCTTISFDPTRLGTLPPLVHKRAVTTAQRETA